MGNSPQVAPHPAEPIFRERLTDTHRGLEDRFLQHVVEVAIAIFVRVVDATLKCFVTAMLAPSLSDGF